MSAVADFVLGAAPEIDPELCRQHRVGVDRVWRVAAVLLDHESPVDGTFWPGPERLSEMTGVHPRTVRVALRVLEGSGVISRAQTNTVHTVWKPGWAPSARRLGFNLRTIEVPEEDCAQRRIGRDKTWRISVLWHATKAAVGRLAELAKTSTRQVRAALAAVGLVASRVLKRRDSRNETPPTTPTPQSQPPTESVPGRAWTRAKALALYSKGSPLMPYDIFEETDRIPDEGMIPTSRLRRQARKKTPRPARGDLPLDAWTPLDSAKEFQSRLQKTHPHAPGDLGNAVQLAKILGKMRNQYGHDARTEMAVLELFVKDRTSIYQRNRHVPLWRKWLASFTSFYAEADRYLGVVDPTYVGYEERFYAENPDARPDTSLPGQQSRLERAARSLQE